MCPGSLLVASADDDKVSLYQTDSGEFLTSRDCGPGAVLSVALSPISTRQWVALAGVDGVKVYAGNAFIPMAGAGGRHPAGGATRLCRFVVSILFLCMVHFDSFCSFSTFGYPHRASRHPWPPHDCEGPRRGVPHPWLPARLPSLGEVFSGGSVPAPRGEPPNTAVAPAAVRAPYPAVVAEDI